MLAAWQGAGWHSGLGASSPCGISASLAGALALWCPHTTPTLAETRLLILGVWGAAYAVHAPLAALLPFTCLLNSEADKEMSLPTASQEVHAEAPAPVCRAAAPSSPLPCSVWAERPGTALSSCLLSNDTVTVLTLDCGLHLG